MSYVLSHCHLVAEEGIIWRHESTMQYIQLKTQTYLAWRALMRSWYIKETKMLSNLDWFRGVMWQFVLDNWCNINGLLYWFVLCCITLHCTALYLVYYIVICPYWKHGHIHVPILNILDGDWGEVDPTYLNILHGGRGTTDPTYLNIQTPLT